MITLAADIARVVAEARAGGRMGLDTEFMRERTYRARLCLVQVVTDASLALIDPMQGADLTPVAEAIGDPSVDVVVHAGKQDLDIFHSAFGVVPANVFDVQVAAGFAGYGASLPLGRLIELLTGASLTKGESYTDWCRRPLSSAQLTYAAADVRYLFAAADRLEQELAAQGRTQWVREELAALARRDSYGVDSHTAWRRVAGRGGLSPTQTAVLRELAAWREETAARRDVPRGWLLKDPTLVQLARRRPRSVADLKAIRGVNAKEAERSGAQLLAAISAGSSEEPIEQHDEVLPRSALVRARMLSGLADAVARSRCEKAGIATELVATRSEMETILAEIFAGCLNESRHRLLVGWRRDLVGRYLLALARGEIAVRAVDVPPYIEEVPV
ncbi:MAG: ribonuclease D [Actinomycetota bacterium]